MISQTVRWLVLYIASLLLPILGAGLVCGWQWVNRNDQTNVNQVIASSVVVAIIIFVVIFSLAFILLSRVNRMPWIGSSLPYIFSAIYSVALIDLIPDIAPFVGQINDGTAMTFGAIFSSLLTFRNNPITPKWAFIPLLLAARYTLFGGVFPETFDELVVKIISFLTFAKGASNYQQSRQNQTTADNYLYL